jgi:CubicO group peptidase (beta-lactamase class C family)
VVVMRRVVATGVIFLHALAISAGALSQQPDPDVCADLDKIRQRHALPGIVAALIDGGQVTKIGAAGVRKVGEAEPMTIHDRIHLGSCTKAMTATLLATFVDQGQLQWDAPFKDVLPQLEDDMHGDWQTVTVRQLLTHRSGLPDNSDLMHKVDSTAGEMQQRLELFREILRQKPAYPPGSEYRYSNLGYMLAGLVAETLADEPWQRLMQQRLFEPLGMTSAGFGPPSREGRIDQPWGHTPVLLLGMRPTQHDNPLVLGPAGRVHATLTDWSRFVALHLHHQPAQRIVSDERIDQMHKPADGEEYALGWGVISRDWAQGLALTHSGSNTYWYAVVWASPSRDLAFLAATNAGGSDAAKACDEAVVSLFSHLGDDNAQAAPKPLRDPEN